MVVVVANSRSTGFLLYVAFVIAFSLTMIYKVSPKYGKKNPLIYISICSTIGSLTVLSCKAFGIAVKLTFAGMNQFIYPSTYVFIIVTVVCILTQMNYFNKALSVFSSSMYAPPHTTAAVSNHPTSVNPIYYVTFTTFTLVASFVLFRGFNTSDPVNTISLICGFLIIFTGVYLLNLSRTDPHGTNHQRGHTRGTRSSSILAYDDGIPTDGLSGLQSRRSMQMRRSESFARQSVTGRRSSAGARLLGRDEEAALGLRAMGEESNSEDEMGQGQVRR